ncbi:DUF2326 domain-containing protein [Micromonospora sp. Llam7]|uniref:DUF2326 domain-containing protein n=1 Tax=Micromonospora tarapacensis TaxID=2835305 RepID=UPI001C839CC5|nr:DUF2326 domain-containing protein [Micromonospora tarapacensis]MBX7269318.1 DUF2326 domain-containing protein [Micromonospora tarapacensis]
MKLKRLYSNRPEIFGPVTFNEGLSAVLAEIRVPANRLLDTHNLGKSTLAELIDYCLLKGKSNSFFLFKHGSLFAAFTFYLEIELPDGEYLTIGRPVDPGSKIYFKRSESSIEDITALDVPDWDHLALPFDRAKRLLDGMLAIDPLRPWGFRKVVGYLIRSQRDYLDVFQLGKFSGKHQDWKPFVAQLIGMESGPVVELYQKKEELNATTADLATLTREWSGEDVDPSVLDGLISVKRRDIDAKTATLSSFNFQEEDTRATSELIDQTESQITALNEESYRLNQLIQRIAESLDEEQVLFRPKDAEDLFRQAGVFLGDQIKREYEQLLAFNRAITEERREALQEQLAESQARLVEIRKELETLNLRRAQSLEFLRNSDSLDKYKSLSVELADLQGELGFLEAKRTAAARLTDLRRQQRTLAEEFGHLETAVETQIQEISRDEESRFGRLRRYFTEIIYEVLGQNAIIAIKLNSQGGLDFTAEFIGSAGTATSGDRGTSYKKLLCIAFDLAFLRTYLDVPFPRFVYHDGALEQLEPRKREKLIGVFRKYAGFGLQPIISLLDSDLPLPIGSGPQTLSPEDVVITLHDEGQNGRLFKMPTW